MYSNLEAPKIKVEPPGPKAREIIEKDRKLLMQSFVRWYPLVAKTGRGAVLEDVDGNLYIDFNSGLAVLNVGHQHPKVLSAIKKQAEKLLHYSITDFYYEEAVTLASKLVKITPGDYDKKLFYGNSGAEAIEAAIKVSRGHFKGKRPNIIAFIGCFHGRTYGALTLTSSKPVQRKNFYPLLPNVEHVPYPYCFRCPYKLERENCDCWCIDFIEEWVFRKYVDPEETSAIFLEPVAGEGGYVVPPRECIVKLRKLTEKYGILLVADEVQSGIGRTGKWFAIEHFNVTPDLITIAKGIASGLPLGVLVGKSEVMDLPGGSHASTFGGNPLSIAAANAVIDVIGEEKLLENAEKVGSHILKRLREMEEKYEIIGEVRGLGLMIGVELVKDKKSKKPATEALAWMLKESFKRGILVIGAGTSVLRIAPPLVIDVETADKGLNVLEELFKEACKKWLNS